MLFVNEPTSDDPPSRLRPHIQSVNGNPSTLLFSKHVNDKTFTFVLLYNQRGDYYADMEL